MSDIAKLYDEVMQKTAAEVKQDETFDKAFFEKVAAGDEESVNALNQFIDEARAESHSDEEIEAVLTQAMGDAGYEENAEGNGGFEQEKMSAYNAGFNQAIEDVLTDEQVKQAGITADDLVEYELGGFYGSGYAEARRLLDDALPKIAMAKEAAGKTKAVEQTAKGLKDRLKGMGGKYLDLLKGGRSNVGGPNVPWANRPEAQGVAERIFGAKGNRLAVAGTRLGTGAAVGGAGYGVYRGGKALFGKKDNK